MHPTFYFTVLDVDPRFFYMLGSGALSSASSALHRRGIRGQKPLNCPGYKAKPPRCAHPLPSKSFACLCLKGEEFHCKLLENTNSIHLASKQNGSAEAGGPSVPLSGVWQHLAQGTQLRAVRKGHSLGCPAPKKLLALDSILMVTQLTRVHREFGIEIAQSSSQFISREEI